jgi:tripartite-type tricarboxylate transporter receptor subunit TctC
VRCDEETAREEGREEKGVHALAGTSRLAHSASPRSFLLPPSAFLLAAAVLAGAADATEPFPVRPIRMVVASITGSAPDIIARHLGAKLTETWGQQIVVDTRPGASGLIGAETVGRAAPDGYTLWLGTQTQLISTILHGKFVMSREFAPAGLVATTTFVFVASAAVPAKTLAEFIEFAKARPGQLFYSTGGEGTSGHLCVELLRRMTGIDLVHVPYKSSPLAMTDMMSGQIHLSCIAAPSVPSFVKSGKVQALAVTSAARTPLAPGLPPAADAVPGYDLTGWYGMLAPRGTPAEIVSRINAAVVSALRDPAFQERLLTLGAEAAGSTPADFAAMLRKDTARWEKALKEIGVRPAQ